MKPDKRPQFGARVLKTTDDVFFHNAWDNVEWDIEQEEQAFQITSEHYKNRISKEEARVIEENANKHWDKFYNIHKTGFFKDRHWLFTEFPELSSDSMTKSLPQRICSKENCATLLESHRKNTVETDNKIFTYAPARTIFEVGCGVGNTVFPILQYNTDPDLIVYCCDFSEEAIKMVKENPAYDGRCEAFVNDITAENWDVPFLQNSIDIIIMIYVLSSINPNKMKNVILNLYKYLRPGGLILFRDYGRYDMSQLRFKKGHCISQNFYVRGECTMVNFFTMEEVRNLFTECGFEEVHNSCDKRLQVNRKRQLKMYRVWIQSKYKKPMCPS